MGAVDEIDFDEAGVGSEEGLIQTDGDWKFAAV